MRPEFFHNAWAFEPERVEYEQSNEPVTKGGKRSSGDTLFRSDSCMSKEQKKLARRIREAEGYLELGLPEQATETLQKKPELVANSGAAQYLLGESLRQQHRYAEAIAPLERATEILPDQMEVALALAWCYKRTGQLASAIDALQLVANDRPDEAILHYNLACYFSLANRRRDALSYLSTALDLDINFLDFIPYESDFDSIRDDYDFQMLTSLIV